MTLLTVPDPDAKRADIQGLRGIAVLAVLLYHADHRLLPGGFTGVDIFFVISGYLITRILLNSLENHHFSLREFYLRRVRRLFPALYVLLAVTLVMGLLLLPPKGLSELAYSQFFTTLFLSNFAFAHLTDYFDTAAGLMPLLHTWSLGVEEQFYLLYPLVVLGLWRFARRWLWPVLAGIALLSLFLAPVFMRARPEASFYLPSTRAFELLIGALCIWWQGRLSVTDTIKHGMSLAGMGLMIAGLFLLNDRLGFTGGAALMPCLGTGLLLLSLDAWGNRLVAAPPLVWTGNLSYSLYLWHWPILVFARMIFGEAIWVTIVALMLAFVAAWASRRYIEVPFIRGFRWTPKHVWRAAASVMTISLASALLIFAGKGLPARFSVTEQLAFAATTDFSHDRKTCHIAKDRRLSYSDTCTHGPSPDATLAVWGDSEGAELAQSLGALGMSVRQITTSACPPSVGYDIPYNRTCLAQNADMMLHLKGDAQIKTVILIANYLRYQEDNGPAMLSGLELSALDLQATGKQVIIVYPLPVYSFDPPSRVGMAMRFGQDPEKVGMPLSQFDSDNAAIIAELDAFTGAHHIAVLKPSDVLCDDSLCHVYDAKTGVLYFNGQHLSLTGTTLLVSKFTSSGWFHRAR